MALDEAFRLDTGRQDLADEFVKALRRQGIGHGPSTSEVGTCTGNETT